jgi:hypothetical protein
MVGLVWLASRVRARGIGNAVLGPLEEIWHPEAHQKRIEVRVQEERVSPTRSPSDE